MWEWKTIAMVPTSVPKYNKCAIIQFLTVENVPGQEIHHRLCAAYKNPNTVTISKLNNWAKKTFKEGQIRTDDKARNSHPPESTNDETTAVEHALSEEDWWQTVCEIKQQTAVEYEVSRVVTW